MKDLNNRGFTFIELLVVIAITAIISVGVFTNLMNFQKEARLDAFTKEFASTLQTARNRSVNGEVPAGVSIEDNDSPTWGVKVYTDKYSLIFNYVISGTGMTYEQETFPIVNGNVIDPLGETDFVRLKGSTTPKSFSLKVSGYTTSENINIDYNGIVKISE